MDSVSAEKDAEQVATSDPTPVPSCGATFLVKKKRGNQEAAALASVHLHALNEDDLITWREGLPEDLKVTTKQRFVNDLKAVLI